MAADEVEVEVEVEVEEVEVAEREARDLPWVADAARPRPVPMCRDPRAGPMRPTDLRCPAWRIVRPANRPTSVVLQPAASRGLRQAGPTPGTSRPIDPVEALRALVPRRYRQQGPMLAALDLRRDPGQEARISATSQAIVPAVWIDPAFSPAGPVRAAHWVTCRAVVPIDRALATLRVGVRQLGLRFLQRDLASAIVPVSAIDPVLAHGLAAASDRVWAIVPVLARAPEAVATDLVLVTGLASVIDRAWVHGPEAVIDLALAIDPVLVTDQALVIGQAVLANGR